MALYGAVAENIRRNERIDRGQVTFTGSVVVTAAAPMRTVTAASATQIATVSPGLNTSTITVGNIGSGGGNLANQFTLFAWSPTSSANPTLIASTVACTAQWECWGTL